MHVAGDGVLHVRLWHEEVGTGVRRALTPADMSVRDYKPSPDGRTIALQLTDGTTAEDDLMFHRIYTIPAAGGEPRLLTPTQGELGPMAWSPNGRQLAFLSAIALHDPLAQSVYVVPATGGTVDNMGLIMDRSPVSWIRGASAARPPDSCPWPWPWPLTPIHLGRGP